MKAAYKTSQKQGRKVSLDSDDEFKYEEVSLGSENSLTEGEEDLEATLRAIQDRAEARTSKQKPTCMVDFLRSFLSQMDMTETLDCFQTEWSEVTARGLVEPDLGGVVPDIYVEILQLDTRLKNARREREEYRQAAASAAGTLARLQKARDSQRLRHMREVQEKNRLIEEMRKLQRQCGGVEPAVQRMNEKYQAALKQVMHMAVERDKALGQTDTEEPSTRRTAPTQPRPPTGPCRQPRGRAVKTLPV